MTMKLFIPDSVIDEKLEHAVVLNKLERNNCILIHINNFLSSDLVSRNNNILFFFNGDLSWDTVTIYEE